MRTWLRRVRGLAGLGVIGSTVGAVLLGGITGVASFQAYGTVPLFGLATAMLIGGFFGGTTTVGFGLLLAITARGKSIEELSFGRAMSMAAATSALVAFGVGALVRDPSTPASVILSQVTVFGVFGAALGGGLLLAAKRARRAELERPSEEPRRIES